MSEYAQIIQPPFGQGPNLMPGLQQFLYFASVGDFKTFPAPPASPATPAEKYTIKTPPTFKVGKCFHEMYIGIEQGQLSYEALGNRDATGFHAVGTGFIPGDSDAMNYFANEAQGDRFIALIPRADGKLALVGTKDFPAIIRALHNSNTVTGDSSGYNVNISAYTPFKYLYEAAVQLDPEPEPGP